MYNTILFSNNRFSIIFYNISKYFSNNNRKIILFVKIEII